MDPVQLTPEVVYYRLVDDGVEKATAQMVVEYAKKNPKLFKAFERYALEVARAGKRIGSMAIVNRIRWFTEIECGDVFKINNNIAPYFARIFGYKYPQYDIFETRTARRVKEIA